MFVPSWHGGRGSGRGTRIDLRPPVPSHAKSPLPDHCEFLLHRPVQLIAVSCFTGCVGLAEEIQRPQLQAFHCDHRSRLCQRAHEDRIDWGQRLRLNIPFSNFAERIQPIYPRHCNVERHKIGWRLRNKF